MTKSDSTNQLQVLINRLRAGEDNAKEQLIAYAAHRLARLAKAALKRYPNARRRGLETGDVVSQGVIDLMSSLRAEQTTSVRSFMSLAAQRMAWRLGDIVRKHQSLSNLAPEAFDSPDCNAQQKKRPEGPATLAEWAEFHSCVGQLPPKPRELFNLLYYMGLSQEEAAKQLDVSVRTVKRDWAATKEAIYDLTHGQRPGHTR